MQPALKELASFQKSYLNFMVAQSPKAPRDLKISDISGAMLNKCSKSSKMIIQPALEELTSFQNSYLNFMVANLIYVILFLVKSQFCKCQWDCQYKL